MFELSDIINIPPYSLTSATKKELYIKALSALTKHHSEGCLKYKRLIEILDFDPKSSINIEDFPFIPVRLFKEHELLSVGRADIVKTMTSSGTSGQSLSKIFLDRSTSGSQTKVLTKLVSSFIGQQRLPMLVIDSSAVIKDRNMFSARGAGILGFSVFGCDIAYALDDEMKINLPVVMSFLDKHKDRKMLLFGFTFMIWEHFYKDLKNSGTRLPIDNGVMIHGGGWKRLIDESVDNDVFKRSIRDVCGVSDIYNYYGMVEQTGSIFMECEYGHFHASIFSDILIRDHKNFASLGFGEKGLIQLISLLPVSYPGYSILSEDIGEIIGEDDCPCGRKGKYFRVHGRVKDAEIRGCSDTYAVSR